MLTMLTLTGVDDTTPIDDLLKLSQKYPFVEWGVLMSHKQEGIGRYPSYQWRKSFQDAVRGTDVHRAMHLCGSTVRELMTQGAAKLAYWEGFQRIQLNFNATRFTDSEISRLAFQAAQAEFWDGTSQGIIVQYNENNKDVPAIFQKSRCVDVQVLFDSSGGSGRELLDFPDPLLGIACGYSGGVGPDNIAKVLDKAMHAAGKNQYWIDMESKLRTEDCFDLDKVQSVLEQTALWLSAQEPSNSSLSLFN